MSKLDALDESIGQKLDAVLSEMCDVATAQLPRAMQAATGSNGATGEATRAADDDGATAAAAAAIPPISIM